MTDHPIIFSAPMIRALLDGRKTQTRRILKAVSRKRTLTSRLADPHYATGDRLWVREAFQVCEDADTGDRWDVYRATTPDAVPLWRSPIHMPRWASRLTLTVTEVRVQRVQEISEADAVAEGADYAANNMGFSPISGQPHGVRTFKAGFAHLWNSIHGPDAWDANPWVAAYTVTVHLWNIAYGVQE